MKRCPYCGKDFPPKGKRRYCSPLCQHRYNSLKTLIGDIEGLRKAVLKQAVSDGVMGWWPRTEAFGKLFPEIDAEILMERMKGVRS